MTRLLETQHLTVQYGGLRANDDIDMSIDEGHVVGLIGPNGAGKTTFIDALTGFAPASGSITFDGSDISNMAPHQRARRGLRRTWQSLELFDDLSVRDNLRVAAHRPSVGDIVLDLLRPRRRSVQHEVDSTLEAVGIAHLADRMPREISYGQRKLVSTARALAGDPRLICMDEPAAGLDTTESAQLGTQLRQIAASGVTILLVDHDMSLVLDVCDDVYVVDFGAVIAHGPPDRVGADPRVVAAYLGDPVESTALVDGGRP